MGTSMGRATEEKPPRMKRIQKSMPKVLMRPSLSSPPPVAPVPMGATRTLLLNMTLFLPTYMGSKR